MKYKIALSGKGAECYLFEITKEQSESLSQGLETDSMDLDSIQDYLDIEDINDCQSVITGPYLGYLNLVVSDAEEKQIFILDNPDFELHEKWIDINCDSNNFLLVENYCKGNFFSFDLETEKDFDINKLTLVITNIADHREIISSILYDGVELGKEWGNYHSKGYNFIIE